MSYHFCVDDASVTQPEQVVVITETSDNVVSCCIVNNCVQDVLDKIESWLADSIDDDSKRGPTSVDDCIEYDLSIGVFGVDDDCVRVSKRYTNAKLNDTIGPEQITIIPVRHMREEIKQEDEKRRRLPETTTSGE